TVSRALWYLFIQADIVIGGRLLREEALGFYVVARQIAWLSMEKGGGVINQVGFPAFSRIQDQCGKVAAYFLMPVRPISFLIFPICFGISALAPEIVHFLIGDAWHQAVLPLQLLSLIVPLRVIFNMANPAVQAVERADTVLVNLLVSV